MMGSAFAEPLELQFTGWKVLVCPCKSDTFKIMVDPKGKYHYYCKVCGNEHQSTKG